MCYQLHAKFDRSNSNVTTYERTRTEIREENGHLASHIFKVIQVHWNRLGSIGLISVDPKQSLGVQARVPKNIHDLTLLV